MDGLQQQDEEYLKRHDVESDEEHNKRKAHLKKQKENGL
jgi:hypothetical protein